MEKKWVLPKPIVSSNYTKQKYSYVVENAIVHCTYGEYKDVKLLSSDYINARLGYSKMIVDTDTKIENFSKTFGICKKTNSPCVLTKLSPQWLGIGQHVGYVDFILVLLVEEFIRLGGNIQKPYITPKQPMLMESTLTCFQAHGVLSIFENGQIEQYTNINDNPSTGGLPQNNMLLSTTTLSKNTREGFKSDFDELTDMLGDEATSLSLEWDVFGIDILAWYLWGNGEDLIIDAEKCETNSLLGADYMWGIYMKNNGGATYYYSDGTVDYYAFPLREVVKHFVFPVGNTLENNTTIKIDFKKNVHLENGEGIIGYHYLHGVNMDVGGFQIQGKISKNQYGDVTYDLKYTWNDIMDPNFNYETDSIKANFANKIPNANPTDYTIKIIWSDKSKIYKEEGFFNRNYGWLSEASVWNKIYIE